MSQDMALVLRDAIRESHLILIGLHGEPLTPVTECKISFPTDSEFVVIEYVRCDGVPSNLGVEKALCDQDVTLHQDGIHLKDAGGFTYVIAPYKRNWTKP